eukprot:Tamp_25412.p1 GENE.Tamp_25412~~Tamp_25412.p1  ORF type:complete len:161 (+),score=22.92 Tamp_25412:153-635(+)
MDVVTDVLSGLVCCSGQEGPSRQEIQVSAAKPLLKRTGLGMILRTQNGKHKVVGLSPEGPARQSGKIGIGMTLSKIDGLEVESKTLEEIGPLLLCGTGETLQLTFSSINYEDPIVVELEAGKFPEKEDESSDSRDATDPIGREERYAITGLSKSKTTLRA